MRRSMRIRAGIGLATVVALACGDESQQAEYTPPAFADAPADTQWVVIEGVEFPAGMETSDPEVLEAYVFAAQHPEVLRFMPCYCGCEHPRSAHTSNYDCFIDIVDVSRDVPRVSPDLMGFT